MNDNLTTTEDVPSENEKRHSRHFPFLFVVLHGDKPALGGARYSLSGIHEVLIGRGSEREVVRTEDRRIELRLPSSTVFKAHAHLIFRNNAWFLEDLGSKKWLRRQRRSGDGRAIRGW